MPASFFNEMDRPSGIGDDRALQLALELSMLGLSDPLVSISEPDSPAEMGSFATLSNVGLEEVRSKKSQNMTECVPVPSSEHVAEIVGRQGKSHSTEFSYRHPTGRSLLFTHRYLHLYLNLHVTFRISLHDPIYLGALLFNLT